MTAQTLPNETLQIINSLKAQLISIFPLYPDIIQNLPDEIFFSCKELSSVNPQLAECDAAFCYNSTLFVLKIEHKLSEEVAAIFFEQARVRFVFTSDTSKKYFEDMYTKRNKLDLILKVLQERSPSFALVTS